jgi:hypothetical protein
MRWCGQFAWSLSQQSSDFAHSLGLERSIVDYETYLRDTVTSSVAALPSTHMGLAVISLQQ